MPRCDVKSATQERQPGFSRRPPRQRGRPVAESLGRCDADRRHHIRQRSLKKDKLLRLREVEISGAQHRASIGRPDRRAEKRQTLCVAIVLSLSLRKRDAIRQRRRAEVRIERRQQVLTPIHQVGRAPGDEPGAQRNRRLKGFPVECGDANILQRAGQTRRRRRAAKDVVRRHRRERRTRCEARAFRRRDPWATGVLAHQRIRAGQRPRNLARRRRGRRRRILRVADRWESQDRDSQQDCAHSPVFDECRIRPRRESKANP
jgi:hypothetical protein